ncbi:lipoprotein NlpI [Rosistilla carotiformis]|uniref:Lipoprotein NlpI n=1 Tax=Rosistilla carotiformis TaxID=2528017 RepID=A0A518JQV9_9BACT|nr:tetratricopeptide repeat protein [Rosistilla carotiformis]QDV67924.1 lipoprotein NlpI [Rosistilla carotiformis]
MLTFLLVLSVLVPIQTVGHWEAEGYRALRSGDTARVAEIAKIIDAQHPGSFSAAMARGSLLLRAGLAQEALVAFDEAAQIQPAQIPFMWQRGIAQYYAGEFEAGRRQFVVHRTVNAHDVENAVWHYMCVARLQGTDAAVNDYLPAPGDSRPPLQEVYDLFAGTASIQTVTDAIAAFPADSPAAKSAQFYGWLYLGMYQDAQGNLADAERWLKKAVSLNQTHYMADVANVHLQQVVARTKETEKPAAQ